MKTFLVQYDLRVYKPNSYEEVKRREEWSLEIQASSLAEAKDMLRGSHNLNPFYFKITEL